MKKIRRVYTYVHVYVVNHKVLTLIAAACILSFSYWAYVVYSGTSEEIRYVLAEARRDTLIVTVSGTGQVSAKNQLELSAKASGDIVALPVKNGAKVAAGIVLARIDARDAQKAVRDAEVNLESAKLALEKLKKPVDALTLTQAENAIINADADLAKQFNDGFNEVADTMAVLPNIISGLDTVLNDNTVSTNQENAFAYANLIDDVDIRANIFRDTSLSSYKSAREAYDTLLATYKTASRFSDTSTIESLIGQTLEATRFIAEAIKNSSDFLNLVTDAHNIRDRTPPPSLATHSESLSSYTATINTQLVALLSYRDALITGRQSIAEKKQALSDLKDGTDVLDIATQELAVQQRENALYDARENVADYVVRAPFAGTLAKLNVKVGDSVSPGVSVATFITTDAIAEISMNEVDVAHVDVGQKTALTFDALDDVRLSGEVIEIDTVGTVSSGVTTYTVTIGFTTDERIKPGMTVNADIATEVVEQALVVPASAVKTDRDGSFVEVVDTPPPAKVGRSESVTGVVSRRVPVTIQLSNDTESAIAEGISEGTVVIARTIATVSTSAKAPSIFQATGVRGPGAGTGGGARPQLRP